MKLKLYFVLPFVLQATLWRIVMRPFFYLFAGFKVEGLEHLKDLPRGVIFAPNHSSELDSILLPLALPFWSRFSPMFYIVREPKFYSDPVFSWRRHLYELLPFKALGAYAIVSGVKDYSVSLKEHVQILNDGGSVCIFPEGGFTKDGTIGKGHGGVGYLANASQRPVVPVCIQGTFGLNFWKVFTRQSKIEIVFGAPEYLQLPVGSVDVSAFKDFADSVLARVASLQASSRSRVGLESGPRAVTKS